MNSYWFCLIGPVDKETLQPGSDSPPRLAAEKAITEMTGYQPANNWSGWGVSEERKEALLHAMCSERYESPDVLISTASVPPSNSVPPVPSPVPSIENIQNHPHKKATAQLLDGSFSSFLFDDSKIEEGFCYLYKGWNSELVSFFNMKELKLLYITDTREREGE